MLVGGSAAVAAAVVTVDEVAGGIASIIAGVILTGFIAIEGWILGEQPGYTMTEGAYGLLGVTMVVLGVLGWLA